MAIIKYRGWDPFKEVAKILDWKPAKMFGWEDQEMRFPALDVEDRGDSLLVKAEIPGVNPNGINLRWIE